MKGNSIRSQVKGFINLTVYASNEPIMVNYSKVFDILSINGKTILSFGNDYQYQVTESVDEVLELINWNQTILK